MTEKLEKKLRKLLAKADVSEEKIDELIEEIKDESDIEETTVTEEVKPEVEEDNPVETPNEDVPVDLPVAPPTEEPSEGDVPPESVPAVEVPNEEPAQVNDGSIEAALNDLAAQGDVPPKAAAQNPVNEPVAPDVAPAIPDPAITELQKTIEELQNANEGLLKRIDSLEEALTKAGLIEGAATVGDETPRVTPNGNQENADPMDEIISVINGR